MMTVQLISAPIVPPDMLAGMAAAICTDSIDADAARDTALQSGHDSIAEHACFTFVINGVSRVLLQQLTRHRIASYSVQSQRYVDQAGVPVVMPESIRSNAEARLVYDNVVKVTNEAYRQLRGLGIPKEDARFALTEGKETNLMLTMNARELNHFFSLRTCNRAQWEIRELAMKMMALCKDAAPVLFAHAGPDCQREGCHEKRPCKKQWKMVTYDGR